MLMSLYSFFIKLLIYIYPLFSIDIKIYFENNCLDMLLWQDLGKRRYEG